MARLWDAGVPDREGGAHRILRVEVVTMRIGTSRTARDVAMNTGHVQPKGDSWSRRMRLAIATLLVLVVQSNIGCTAFSGLSQNLAYNDSVNDAVMGWRNSVWARQAWFARRGSFVGEPQFYAFGEGFRDGYADAASGGNGCPPAISPRKFWSWKYQTPEGQAKVAAWYAGYPYGAQAAEEDGASNFQGIQVSHWVDAQYSPEFQSGNCPDCPPGTDYPQMEHEREPYPAEGLPNPAPMRDPSRQVPTDATSGPPTSAHQRQLIHLSGAAEPTVATLADFNKVTRHDAGRSILHPAPDYTNTEWISRPR